MSLQQLPFIDLDAQRRHLGPKIDSAIARVLAHGQYILGPEVRDLEHALAGFCGAAEVVSCANGTDALSLVLLAKGVAAGQAVFCPAFTFAATAEVIAARGATPFFVDIDPTTYTIDARSLEQSIAGARRIGCTPVGVIPVDLFGHPADYHALEEVCVANELWMLCDAAQSFGASYGDRRVGGIGLATTTSFFPSKPLGCYGDGGAIFTDDCELANLLRSLRVHGEGVDKYDNVRIGGNSRLDSIQAAILLEKLSIFEAECEQRQMIAERYSAGLEDIAEVPVVQEGCTSVWAQYTIRIDATKRDHVQSTLKAQGIPTAIYYRRPLHLQPAYKSFPVAGNGLPVSEKIADEVLSLPMHAYLALEDQERIVTAVRRALN